MTAKRSNQLRRDLTNSSLSGQVVILMTKSRVNQVILTRSTESIIAFATDTLRDFVS